MSGPVWQQPQQPQPPQRRFRRALWTVGLLAAATLAGLLVRVDDGGAPADSRLEVAERSPEPRPTPRRTRSPRARPTPRPTPPDAAGTWMAGTAEPPLPARDVPAVWSGTELLVWGGELWEPDGWRTRFFADGGTYDPATDRWRLLPPGPLTPRAGHTAVWAGGELIVWGGRGPVGLFSDGAAYDPAADRWRPLAPSPLSPRAGATGVWTGKEVLLLGGTDNTGPLSDFAAYDPARDAWRLLSFPDAFADRPSYPEAEGLWDGQAAVFWHRWASAGDEPGSGWAIGRYEPAAGSWTDLPAPPAPEDGGNMGLAWTGEELVALFSGYGQPADIAVLGLEDEAWRPVDLAETGWRTSTQGEPIGVWGGERLYVLIGAARPLTVDVRLEQWHPLPEPPLGRGATWASGVWTGEGLLAWRRSEAVDEQPWFSTALWRPAAQDP